MNTQKNTSRIKQVKNKNNSKKLHVHSKEQLTPNKEKTKTNKRTKRNQKAYHMYDSDLFSSL